MYDFVRLLAYTREQRTHNGGGGGGAVPRGAGMFEVGGIPAEQEEHETGKHQAGRDPRREPVRNPQPHHVFATHHVLPPRKQQKHGHKTHKEKCREHNYHQATLTSIKTNATSISEQESNVSTTGVPDQTGARVDARSSAPLEPLSLKCHTWSYPGK
jgi:hypothetical protein